MEAKAIAADNETIAVAKRDLVDAWAILEKVVVSLRKMGSYYSTPSADVPLGPDERKNMLEDLDAFFSPEIMRELAQARRLLSEYIPDDESEALSDNLSFWQARTTERVTENGERPIAD